MVRLEHCSRARLGFNLLLFTVFCWSFLFLDKLGWWLISVIALCCCCLSTTREDLRRPVSRREWILSIIGAVALIPLIWKFQERSTATAIDAWCLAPIWLIRVAGTIRAWRCRSQSNQPVRGSLNDLNDPSDPVQTQSEKAVGFHGGEQRIG